MVGFCSKQPGVHCKARVSWSSMFPSVLAATPREDYSFGGVVCGRPGDRGQRQAWGAAGHTEEARAWCLLPLGRPDDASVSHCGWNFCESERPLRYLQGPAPAGAGTSGHSRAEHAGPPGALQSPGRDKAWLVGAGVWGASGGSLAWSRARARPPFLPKLRGCGPGQSPWWTCRCGSGADQDFSVDKV